MIGERENFDSQTQYGSLAMRSYDIDGNEISAFYDSSDNLIFVLDNTITSRKPNILLVINPDANKKWDEILAGDYGVDLETIRPKQDNKYQKFDIEYSGLPIYDALIKAYNAGDSLEESLNQLMILRDSAARHSAMTRLSAANEIITKTNATIVKTKESIVRLQARLKTLRAKLTEAKKGIGREPTKQSAAKVLKLESQIEATNEKMKRAQERLKSAQRRLEIATVDAELAGELLNQPSGEIKQITKKQAPIVVPAKQNVPAKVGKIEPEYEESEEEETLDDYDESDNDNVKEEYIEERTEEKTEEIDENERETDSEKVEPLFKEDPQIINNDIAFKPISFKAPDESESDKSEEKIPELNHDMLMSEETTETVTEKDFEPEEAKDIQYSEIKEQEHLPVLESMKPITKIEEEETFEPDVFETEEGPEKITEEIIEEKPYESKSEMNTEEEPLDVDFVHEDLRQSEPVVEEPVVDTAENKHYEESLVLPPVPPVPPVMPQSASSVNTVYEETPKRSKFFYYLLLILLIVLAVFTLWLYQKNIKPSVPILAASVEKTELPKEKKSVFKKSTDSSKTSKNIKAPVVKESKRGVEPMPVFLDEPVVETISEPVVAEEPEIEEDRNVVIESGNAVPEVVDDVPARVTTSGQGNEVENKGLTEEDILANKPVYQPGSKYDEMFVADEGGEIISPTDVEYVEDNIVYMPEEVQKNTQEDVSESVEYNVQVLDPYFDEEEAAYQAEQSELYYEE